MEYHVIFHTIIKNIKWTFLETDIPKAHFQPALNITLIEYFCVLGEMLGNKLIQNDLFIIEI